MQKKKLARGVSPSLGLTWSRSTGTKSPPKRIWVVFGKAGRPARWEPEHIETNQAALHVALEEYTENRRAFVVREFTAAVPIKRRKVARRA